MVCASGCAMRGRWLTHCASRQSGNGLDNIGLGELVLETAHAKQTDHQDLTLNYCLLSPPALLSFSAAFWAG